MFLRRRPFFVAVMSLLSLTASLLGAMPAGAQDAPEEGLARPWIRAPHAACPAGVVPEPAAEDVSLSYHPDVACVLWYGIAAGIPRHGRVDYRRLLRVTRGQMATFVGHLIDYAAGDGTTRPLPSTDDDRFSDTDGNVHARNISRLAEAGIVRGGPHGAADDEFAPGRLVRRGQMATFLNGAHEWMLGEPLESGSRFFDDVGGVHAGNVAAIAEHGITGGVGGPGTEREHRYRPNAAVQRGQMASFLMRLLDILVYEGRVTTPARRAGGSNESFPFRDAPDTAETSSTALTDEGATELQVTRVGDEAVSLALFRCADVLRLGNAVAFRDQSDPAGHADLTVDDEGAVIEQVNGTPRLQRDSYVGDVEPQDGKISFVVDSSSADCTVGVAFVDADDDEALAVDGDGAPTEPFGASDGLLFLPAAAGDGQHEATVLFVERTGHAFVGVVNDEPRTFDIDVHDSFDVGDARVGFGELTARLSTGDTVVAEEYVHQGESRLRLVDAEPQPPTVDATWEPKGTTLSWRAPDAATAWGYRIYEQPCIDDLANPRYLRSVGEVTANTTTFLHAVPVRGCMRYHVRTVDRRDESRDTDGSTAEITGEGFHLLDATVTRDRGKAGRLDPGDRHRFVFNREMDPSIAMRSPQHGGDASGGRYDLHAEHFATDVTVFCTAEGHDADPQTTDCALNDEAVTVGGQTHGPRRVLTANIGTDQHWADSRSPAYPLSVRTNAGSPWHDIHGYTMSYRSPDRTLQP